MTYYLDKIVKPFIKPLDYLEKVSLERHDVKAEEQERKLQENGTFLVVDERAPRENTYYYLKGSNKKTEVSQKNYLSLLKTYKRDLGFYNFANLKTRITFEKLEDLDDWYTRKTTNIKKHTFFTKESQKKLEDKIASVRRNILLSALTVIALAVSVYYKKM